MANVQGISRRGFLQRTASVMLLAAVPGVCFAQLKGQTKRVGQRQIIEIIDGNPQAAIGLCEKALKRDPNHVESLYNMTVALARLGRKDEATAYISRALAAGLPFDRFVAGPRDLLKPLTDTDEFEKLAAQQGNPLIHGPMLGCVTDRSAKFWVRTAEEVSVQVVVGTSADLSGAIKSASVFTEAGRDYTAVASVEVLKPNTRYYYDVLLDGKSALPRPLPAFSTFPTAGDKARFEVGFGGGAGYTPKHEHMWNTIASHHLLAFLLLGDNVYIDNPTRPDVQHYTYYRRQSRPEYRRFAESTAIFAIWDDHDFCANDGRGGPEIRTPDWKVPVWKVFKNNWNNPAYGGGERQPGCWFKFSIGDVDFFMLDGRYYRTKPKGKTPSMLGPVQKKWLLKELRHSQATFKVLASPVPWVFEAKGHSLDTWNGYRNERNEIFATLEKNKIEGVILISADRHRSDLWRIDRPKAYPLYEFESSRLTNIHTHAPVKGSLFSYNRKCSFGVLDFDTEAADPRVSYKIYNIDNKLIHTVELKKSQLSY